MSQPDYGDSGWRDVYSGPEDTQQLLPLEEALKRLGGIDRSTFYRMCRKGEMAAIRTARKVWVDQKWIDEYFARLKHEAVQERDRRARAERARKGRKK